MTKQQTGKPDPQRTAGWVLESTALFDVVNRDRDGMHIERGPKQRWDVTVSAVKRYTLHEALRTAGAWDVMKIDGRFYPVLVRHGMAYKVYRTGYTVADFGTASAATRWMHKCGIAHK